ncbi:MAG: hypothetical protein MUE74_10860, partial [Bacteroidales bacterium]|nr:hypothetical protein [Bacteroidales bacterium]
KGDKKKNIPLPPRYAFLLFKLSGQPVPHQWKALPRGRRGSYISEHFLPPLPQLRLACYLRRLALTNIPGL